MAETDLDFFISYAVPDERWATWLAGTLEAAGYRTMLQAWDFVAGSRFMELMDRGISQSALIVAVLSSSYLNSRYGRLEWQAALLAQPENPEKKLITIRIEDCPITGLLAQLTYVDMVGISDPEVARGLVLRRVEEALAGRAVPTERPRYPGVPMTGGAAASGAVSGDAVPGGHASAGALAPQPAVRRRPVMLPPYPAAARFAAAGQPSITLLHICGPRFGQSSVRPDDSGGNGLHARVLADVTQMVNDGAPRPDLLLVSGDLAAAGGPQQFRSAYEMLSRLRVRLGLEPDRVVIVPGTHDVNRAACRMHFDDCEANEQPPTAPYWPKWRHFCWLFRELYQGLDGVLFEPGQPWTMFAVPSLRLVVAGLNSSMAITHRAEQDYGAIGNEQAAWFGQQLHDYEDAGWLRIGLMSHPPGAGAESLRDTDLFSRLVAPRLNLLVHGPGPAGPGSDTADAGLTCISLSEPGDCELIELSEDALTLWDTRSPGKPDRAPLHWRNARAAFSAASPAAEPEISEPAEPAERLLNRIEEVCQARYERVRIRRVRSVRPYLIATYNDSGIVRELVVAALPGTPALEDIEAFGDLVRSADEELSLEVVYLGALPEAGVREEARRAGLRLRSFTEFQGLLDLRAYVAAQSARMNASRLYPPSLYVPQRFTELDHADPPARNGLLEELLGLADAEHGRFVLLLGDFGCGKTFALRQLALRIATDLPHLTPIFIELRTLDKAHSIEGMVAAHLADNGEQNIDLRAFQFMLRQGRIVLLFDGFDELVTRTTYEQAAEHLDTLLAAATDNAKIIVTSRTQHFKSRAQVLTSLGERVEVLPQRRLLGIERFSPDQIREYLINHYRGDVAMADSRLALIAGVENLLDLAHNPRMLSFVADLEPERLKSVARAGDVLSPAALYSEILSAWLAGEERRTAGIRGAAPGLSLDDLWRAVTALALRLWEADEALLNLSDLEETANALAGLAQTSLSLDETAHAIGAGTLLIRTDDGLFGFIHGSVVEWLIANEIARRLASGDGSLLSRRVLSQLTIDFLCDLSDARTCEAWVTATQSDPASDTALVNARKISIRLRVPPHANLRGASLQNEDLSFRDLTAVDLTDADLTGAQLVRARLAGAVLRGARLVDARLDGAALNGADLSSADLSRARLTGADLRGAITAGSRWQRAAVIAATVDTDLASRPELRGAAIAPGMPVDPQLYPAKVGVRYGFHINFGRLPLPVAYSADGGILAVGCDNGSVLLSDARNGQPIRVLAGHHGRAYAVVPGPADTLITAGADLSVQAWDATAGRVLWTHAGLQDWAWPVTVSPVGDLLAISDASAVVRLLDVRTGEVRHRLSGAAAPVWTAAFSPDGTRFACGGSDATVRIWDTVTGEQTGNLRAPEHAGTRQDGHGEARSVYRVLFHPAGKLLAATDESGGLRVWDTDSGTLQHHLEGHARAVYAFDFHPSGQLLASADTSGIIRLWELPSGRPTGVLAVHVNAVYQVLFSPDGSLMSTCDSEGQVRLWSVALGQEPAVRPHAELSGHRSAVWPGSFRPDSHQFATASSDVVYLWNTTQGRQQHTMRGHGRRVVSVSFQADGRLLAACGQDGVIRIWDPATGQQLTVLTGTADQFVSATFSPAAGGIAAASNSGRVCMLSVGSGASDREMGVETEKLWALAFSPDGQVLATANDDDSVRLWNHHTGAQSHAFGEHQGRVRSIDFSSTGTTLATACDDGKVRVFDLASGACTATLSGHADRVYSVAFAPGGQRLASASWDGTARIWDLADQSCVLTLSRQRGRLWALAFSLDGSVLVSAGDEGTIDAWDPRTGSHLGVLRGHADRIAALAFSPAGGLLASGGDDGTVRLWDVTDPSAMSLRATLVGHPEGWLAFGATGSYKSGGAIAGEFWYAVGACRFEPGDLDEQLPEEVRRLPDNEPL